MTNGNTQSKGRVLGFESAQVRKKQRFHIGQAVDAFKHSAMAGKLPLSFTPMSRLSTEIVTSPISSPSSLSINVHNSLPCINHIDYLASHQFFKR